ncbi:MAG TPA: hypothetical protein PLL76_21575 [Thermoanaerobaculia bacterium]|nr:hypothetical protein [Thermoanaerobaculia bacterium]
MTMSKKPNGKPTKKPAAPKAKAPSSPRVRKPAAQKPTPRITSEPKAAGPIRTPDPRLPAVGTLIQKRDRHGAVRCECTVEPGGIRYSGTLYRSISSAALAAAKDLGRKNRSENGYVFWGLVKPSRPASDPIPAFERAWQVYLNRAEVLIRDGLTEGNRERVATALALQVAAITRLEERVAAHGD